MIYNLTRRTILAMRPLEAVSFFQRLRGMCFRHFASCDFDALIFDRCSDIHTMWMLERIDVVFIDCDNVVCGMREEMAPWRMAFGGRKARRTIELPAGTIAASGTQVGDVLDYQCETTSICHPATPVISQ